MIYDFFLQAKECAVSLLPLLITFILFQIFSIKMSVKSFFRILIAVFISYIGLVFLIFGLNLGYVPIGRLIGLKVTELSYTWVILPIGFIIGFIITRIEPSVQVLINDIDKETGGAVSKKVFLFTLSVGVGISVVLALLKILLSISLWYIIVPGYVIALILAFMSSERFTAIAFDAGGVTTGIMTSTFLLSLALGIAEGNSGMNSAADGFGLIAIVAMTPIITVLLLGKIYDLKNKKEDKRNAK